MEVAKGLRAVGGVQPAVNVVLEDLKDMGLVKELWSGEECRFTYLAQNKCLQ